MTDADVRVHEERILANDSEPKCEICGKENYRKAYGKRLCHVHFDQLDIFTEKAFKTQLECEKVIFKKQQKQKLKESQESDQSLVICDSIGEHCADDCGHRKEHEKWMGCQISCWRTEDEIKCIPRVEKLAGESQLICDSAEECSVKVGKCIHDKNHKSRETCLEGCMGEYDGAKKGAKCIPKAEKPAEETQLICDSVEECNVSRVDNCPHSTKHDTMVSCLGECEGEDGTVKGAKCVSVEKARIHPGNIEVTITTQDEAKEIEAKLKKAFDDCGFNNLTSIKPIGMVTSTNRADRFDFLIKDTCPELINDHKMRDLKDGYIKGDFKQAWDNIMESFGYSLPPGSEGFFKLNERITKED